MAAPTAIDLDSIRERAKVALSKHGVIRAGVFGSFVRGAQKPDSDVDFLVEFEPGRSLLDLSGLRLDLIEVLGRDVDVVTRNALHPAMRDAVLAEQVEIL